MNKFKILCLSSFLIAALTSCSQVKNDKFLLKKEYAQQQLALALNDTAVQHNVVNDNSVIIKDSLTAISVAEPILFSSYGKENILKQRPYEVYLLGKYWVLMGTLHTHKGGTFLIIIDATNNKILRITHGK